jgi:hypothetical protein
MHVMVIVSPHGLVSAMTGRDRPDGMLINLHMAELKESHQGGWTVSFEIPDKDTDGVKHKETT